MKKYGVSSACFPSQKICTSSGFTIIELLVALLIIGILSSIAFKGASYVFILQDEKKAKSEIDAIKLALQMYKSEHGSYPQAEIGTTEERGDVLFKSLSGFVNDNGTTLAGISKEKSFLPINSFSLGIIKGATVVPHQLNPEVLLKDEALADAVLLVDPWGNPYEYQYPRSDGHLGYILRSPGTAEGSGPISVGCLCCPN